MSHDITLFFTAAVLAALLLGWLASRRQRRAGADARSLDALDTVAAWPPEATRLLTGAERKAHQMLSAALPDHMVLAQVPVARFIKVPRRHSYAQWVTRVGQMSADLLVCDRTSQVLAAIVLRTANSSERSQKRRERMAKVLKAAGVKMLVWPEDALPSPSMARDHILAGTAAQAAAAIATAAATPAASAASAAPAMSPALRALREEMPLPEVLDEDEGNANEPPPSTWFDDLDPLPAAPGAGWKNFSR